MTYKNLLDEAVIKIKKADLEPNVAILLLIHYTKEKLANIYANLDEKADEKIIKLFNDGLSKYVNEHLPYNILLELNHFRL